MRPQMVDVLPVPGGLFKIVRLRCKSDYGETLPLNERKTIHLKRAHDSSCLWLVDIVYGHGMLHLALFEGGQSG